MQVIDAFKTWWTNGQSQVDLEYIKGMTITYGNYDKLNSEILCSMYTAQLIDIILAHKSQIEKDGYAITLTPEQFLLLNHESQMKLWNCYVGYKVYANPKTMFILKL